MSRVAVFVDAGYLFAQGSTALTGSKKPRQQVRLNITAIMAELQAVAATCAAGCSFLRVYWYDGAPSYKGPTLEQNDRAHTDGVKLRLGFINSTGQQKGVDSLIVTDLIDLARNHAIGDAVLLSGDEDVRIGVQIAQQFGVRLHLVGIAPSRGSQSKQLLQEADTTTEWDAATVTKFLTVTSLAPVATPVAAVASQPTPLPAVAVASATNTAAATAAMLSVVDGIVAALDTTQVTSLKSHLSNQPGIPPEFDGVILGKSRDIMGRTLSLDERKLARARFKSGVQAR